ncbi:tRNA lysidine(34) synthetase TilS [Polaribacter sp. R77954]|uniref:tRNA lysidine(34) synthetase TilS n=1 Tax=Polaribacter sp. R77954 TaxID=3093870 RepID=UPI0037C58B48
MLQEFKTHINTNFPFLKDKKIVIAISGGLDSVVLYHLLHQLQFNIFLAHCNFKLREQESDLDEEFVVKLSQKSSNQIFRIEFDTDNYAKKHKCSTQIAARELRYNWFQELLSKYNFDYIATAHHADDNLETFLINLTRGTGLEGLTGIPETNGNIIRPLLPFSREEILLYAKKNNIEWREDASNAATKYTRNKIRHLVIPVLKEINPSLLASFSNSLNYLEESKQIIEDRIEEVSKLIITPFSCAQGNACLKINIHKIQQLSNPKAYLYQFLKAYHFTEWDDVYHLLSAQSGKQVFSKTHRLLKDRDVLILSKKSNGIFSGVEKLFFIEQNQTEITHPIRLTFKKVAEKSKANKQTIYVDKDLLKYPLIVRKRKNGDYLYPAGMQGKKKLSKYFKDEKLSLLEKENTWLLCNADYKIIWVINYRQDRRFLPQKTTENYLKITQL